MRSFGCEFYCFCELNPGGGWSGEKGFLTFDFHDFSLDGGAMTLDVWDEFAELYFLQEELVFPGRVSEQDFGFVGMEFIFLDIIICESFDVHYYYYCCMNKKNTGKYFNHVQNTSPAKTAFSFKKNKRFPTEKT